MTDSKSNGSAELILDFSQKQAEQVRAIAQEIKSMGESYVQTLLTVADDIESHGKQTAEVATGTMANIRELVDSAVAKKDDFHDNMNALAGRFHRMSDEAHEDALAAVEKAISDVKAA